MKDIIGNQYDLGSYFVYINRDGKKKLGKIVKTVRLIKWNGMIYDSIICKINAYNNKVRFTRLDKAVIISELKAELLFPEDYKVIRRGW